MTLEPETTYEVWEQERGKFGWKDPERRHPGERGFPDPRIPESIVAKWTEEQKYHDRYEPEGSEPTTRYFVVEATTTFKEHQ